MAGKETNVLLTTHATFHSVYYFRFGEHADPLLLRKKEGNILFNDAPNTFYLRLYGVGHGQGPFK